MESVSSLKRFGEACNILPTEMEMEQPARLSLQTKPPEDNAFAVFFIALADRVFAGGFGEGGVQNVVF
jgi:hypothetical protein